jgi:hypothetical protein
MEELD